MKKIIYLLTLIVIIAGIIITAVVGLKYNFDIKGGERLYIDLAREFDVKDVEKIAKEVLNSKIQVETIEILGEVVGITSDKFTEEQIDGIVNKLNEKYETDEYTKESVEISYIPNVRIRDLVSNYIYPIIAIVLVALVYTVIISDKKILNTILMFTGIILAAALLLSILAILRIVIDKGILMTGMITLILTILFITFNFIKKIEVESKKNILFISLISVFFSIGVLISGIISGKNILIYFGTELIWGVLISVYASFMIIDMKNKILKN